MIHVRLILFAILAFNGCDSRKANTDDYATYEDNLTGWTTRYPTSLSRMTEEEMAQTEGRGKSAMEETIDGTIELTHKNLLWLKKDQFNMFTSNAQPFDTETDGSYEDNQKLLYSVLEETYTSQGIQYDVKYGKTKLDGLDFSTMETTLYTPDRKKVIMQQVMYDRFIDGKLSLTLNINFNNENDRKLLTDIITSSKFSKRN